MDGKWKDIKSNYWYGLGYAVLCILALLLMNISEAYARGSSFDKKVKDTLGQCKQLSVSCRNMTEEANGILVFPDVIKADLIVGGAGGKGALIEDGKITGYYNIGAVSAGLQAGIASANQVYVFRTAEALAELKRAPDWKAGARADVALVEADATASQLTSKNVLVYIFDAKGLHAGVALDIFNVWKAEKARPS